MGVAESIARWAYDRTFFSQRIPPGPAAILGRLVGSDRIRFEDGQRSLVDGCPRSWSVVLPRGVAPEILCLETALAVASVAWVEREPLRSADGRALRRTAAAVVMPGPALAAVLRAIGPRTEEIGRAFRCPRELVSERLELLGLHLASGEYRRPSIADAS